MPVVGEVIANLRSAIDALVDADPASLGDGETVVALHRQLERQGAIAPRAAAARRRAAGRDVD